MKILVSDPLSEEGLKILKDVKEFQVEVKTELKPEVLKETIKNYDALIVRSATKVTKEIIEAATKLKVIGRAGVGLDNVDLEAATQKGIIVMNTPGGNTISTAEHTVSMILSLSRNIPQANASTKKGEWKRSKFMGVELYGKTLGIVGLEFSIIFHAFWLTEIKPKPGGSIRPFCEPETTTSQNQASVCKSIAPKPLMASITNTASVSFTTLPIAVISVATPVEVSQRVVNTAFILGLSFSLLPICAGSTAFPHSTLITSQFIPYA